MKIPKLITDQKHIFGTYSAMALKNIQIVLDHIQKVTNITDSKPDRGAEDFWDHPVLQFLWDRNNSTQYPEITNEIIDRLLRNFPFLKIMADNQREHNNKRNNTSRLEINSSDITYVLNIMFRVLKKYRDYSLHYIMVDNSFDDGSYFLSKSESPLAIILNSYYTIALRNVKDRYNYSTEQLAFIQDYRYVKDVKTRKMVANFDFFLSMQSFNDDSTRKLHLSGVGVVQLICLFLEKKYSNLFISKLPIWGKYKNSSEEAKIIRRSLLINSIVLPKERIQSTKREMSIAMDMLNEMKRCPKELFDVLSYEDQDRFRIISSDYNEVTLIRSTDRFAQLSLQYIDYNNLFEKIRFHVNMGKLRYLFSPNKTCIDGQVRVRVLEHKLNGYGRIAEMEQYRRQKEGVYGDTNIAIRDFDSVKRDDACTDNYPYVVDTYANYMLENNKVEICFNGDKIVPDVRFENGKWHVEKEPPHCRLSTLELPAMMFHLHLLGSKKTEARIFEVYRNYKRLFTALSNGELSKDNINSFGIAQCDMPQKVLDAVNGVTNRPNFNQYVKKIVDELRLETELLIKRFNEAQRAIKSNNNKMGTRSYRQIRIGKLAEFLARDIVKFQPSQKLGDGYGTDRITGLNYRVMQSSIAVYDSYGDNSKIQEFCDIFRHAKLIDCGKKQEHPFLGKALYQRPQNAVEFYRYYLQARRRYLSETSKRIEEGETVSLPFANSRNNKWLPRNAVYYQTMGLIYNEDMPIELPRQMFDNEIKAALKKMPQMSDVDFDNANVTYLIGEYMKRVHNDAPQEFYSWNRNYRFIDMLICDKNKNNTLSTHYTTTSQREELWENRMDGIERYKQWSETKRITDRNLMKLPKDEYEASIAKRISNCRNEYQHSEKHIRRYKVQDALMFLLAKDTLTQNVKFSAEDFKLKDIMPDSDKGILSESMPIEFTFERKGVSYTIKSKSLKLKNYGDFFALAHDKRITSLLEILPTKTIDKDEIVEEFDNYDTNRPEVVRLVLDLEKYVYDKYPDIKKRALTEFHFDFLALLKELLQKGDLAYNESVVLQKIRNSFSHNSYPESKIIEIKTLPDVANHLIERFGKYVTKVKS